MVYRVTISELPKELRDRVVQRLSDCQDTDDDKEGHGPTMEGEDADALRTAMGIAFGWITMLEEEDYDDDEDDEVYIKNNWAYLNSIHGTVSPVVIKRYDFSGNCMFFETCF